MISLTCGFKIWHRETSLQNRNKLIDTENKPPCGCQGGKVGEERLDWEFGAVKCKLFYLDWINNKVLMYNSGDYIQYSVINYNGKEYKIRIYTCLFI